MVIVLIDFFFYIIFILNVHHFIYFNKYFVFSVAFTVSAAIANAMMNYELQRVANLPESSSCWPFAEQKHAAAEC